MALARGAQDGSRSGLRALRVQANLFGKKNEQALVVAEGHVETQPPRGARLSQEKGAGPEQNAGADRLLKAEEPHVLACYTAMPTIPPARGAIAFSIGLDATGMVSTVGVTRTGSLPLPIASCVKALLVDMTFDAPADGATTINGRFTFAPAEAPK